MHNLPVKNDLNPFLTTIVTSVYRSLSVEGPERIKDIGYVLKMVTDKDIIPDEFRELYETFCNTLKIRR